MGPRLSLWRAPAREGFRRLRLGLSSPAKREAERVTNGDVLRSELADVDGSEDAEGERDHEGHRDDDEGIADQRKKDRRRVRNRSYSDKSSDSRKEEKEFRDRG